MGTASIPVFIFLILLFLSSGCQSADRLTQAKPLLPGDVLISNGGDFALGFFPPSNSSNSMYIGIWYHSIPERTVVWVANRDNPITAPSSPKLAVTSNSELVLSDSTGRIFWTAKTNIATARGAGAFAMLSDAGNFVLRLPRGMDIWQSFDDPTDTMLPTMRFLLSYKAQVAGRLVAWKGPGDPSTGDISYSMDPTSNNLQVVIWNGTLPYFRSGVRNDLSVSGVTYHGNSLSQATVITGDKMYWTLTVSPGSPYTRLLLHYTGKMRVLSWNNTTSSWAVISEAPTADCDRYASCGPFGYCDHTEAIPTCRCPDGFELVDSLNFSKGCRRKGALRCRKENYFAIIPNMKAPDKFLLIGNRSFDQCAAECSRNCSCMAYAYANLSAATMGDTSRCLVWTGDLIDMEKASFYENLYVRLGESPGTRVLYTSSSHFFHQK